MRLAGLVLLSALVILTLGSCQQEEATSTPVPAAAIERMNLAVTPSLLTLARNPAAFAGQDLRLAGTYKPLPLLVCAGETHQSPATWALSDGQIEILASGFDGALRRLASPGLPLEVEGSWQRWEGPVGCGRRAPSQLVWHLQLTNIVSPNPLSAALAFTPEPAATAAVQPVSTEITNGLGTTEALAEATTENQSQAGTGATPTPGLPGATAGIASVTPTASIQPGSSATSTATPVAGTSVTPSATPLGTPTATLAAGASTLTPTPTTNATGSSPTATVDSGRPILLDYDDLSKRTISAGGVQEWQFAGATALPIALRVAPSSGLDVALDLYDPSDELVDVYDLAGAGQPETIAEDDLPVAGLYTVKVRAANQTFGSYAIVLQSESSRPFVLFQGTLNYGDTRAGTTPPDGDHLWNFEGVAGDVINIKVRATTPTDLQLYLNSHDGQETEYVNDNTVYFPPEDREEILGYRLPATGLYTIGIGEEDLESLGYTIVIERAS